MFLEQREPGLIEKMDRDDCDLNKLHNTYDQFHYVNLLISKWRSIYKREIRPVLNSSSEQTLLDIGFGAGDITRSIEKWAIKDGYDIKITAIDPDDRANEYCKAKYPDSDIQWLKYRSSDLVEKNHQYDIVISNHVIHHLIDEEILKLLRESKILSKRKVIFNDIERSALGYFMFNVLSRMFFRDSFITEDGLTSIRRSFKPSELRDLIPAGWEVKRSFPYRLFVVHEK